MPEELMGAEVNAATVGSEAAKGEQVPSATPTDPDAPTAGQSDAAFEDDGAGSAPAADPQRAPRGDKSAQRAAQRREREQRERQLQETREQAIIDALGGKNPYTDADMKDSEDVKEFLLMREIEKKGGDPVTDFSRYQKDRAREQSAAARRAEEEQQWFEKDRASFLEKHPTVNLDELIADEDFADYADGKVGKKPLAEIYEGYLRSAARFEERARNRAAQAVANREASPGALGTAGSSDTGYYTPEQVDAMSFEEVKKNLPKINESMKRWK